MFIVRFTGTFVLDNENESIAREDAEQYIDDIFDVYAETIMPDIVYTLERTNIPPFEDEEEEEYEEMDDDYSDLLVYDDEDQ